MAVATGPPPRSVVAYLDEEGLIERILGHVAEGTTDLSPGTWREPVDNYRSAERLGVEVGQVIRRWPVPFCPSAALSEPGAYVARVAAGVPVLAVRDRDGVARAFRNACRHRGAAVAAGTGCVKSFVCPFHGWTYRLDGALRHVPDEYGFPGLDRQGRGLVPLDSVEQGGMVFVDQDGGGDNRASLGALPELLGPDQRLLEATEYLVDANWKVLTEGFLEGYHLRATHRETFLPFGYDNLTVVEHSGPHSRVTFPFKRVEALRGLPRGGRRLDGAATVVDHVFPNVIVARLSHHTAVVVLEPLRADRSRQVVYQLTNRLPAAPPEGGTGDGVGDAGRGGAPDGAPDDARRDADFVRVGAVEDLGVAMAVQQGLGSGANEFVEFGRFEGALAHFHEHLDRALAASADGHRQEERPVP